MASGSNNEGASFLFAKFLDLKERISETGKKIEKLIEAWCNNYIPEMVDLNASAAKLMTDFEDLNSRLQKFVKQFCPSGVQNLDSSELETELGRSLSDLAKDSQEAFLRGIQDFEKEFEVLDVKVCSDLLDLDDFHVSAAGSGSAAAPISGGAVAVSGGAEEHHRSLMADLKKLLEEGIKEMYPMGSTKSGTNPSGNDQNLGLMIDNYQNLSLSNIMIRMYGFRLEKAQEIEMEIAKELERNLDSGSLLGSSESKILNWKDLEMLKSVTPQNEGEHLRNLRNRVFQLETAIYGLIRHLHSLMSGYEEASGKLQELRNLLGELKHKNGGMVPIVVYKILALLELKIPSPVVGSSGSSSGSGIVDQQAALYRKMEFSQMIDSIGEIIMHLRVVLGDSGISTASTISPDVLGKYDKVLLEAEEELRKTEGKIEEAKWDVLRKRKSEDEAGSSSGMSEKAKGKMARRD